MLALTLSSATCLPLSSRVPHTSGMDDVARAASALRMQQFNTPAKHILLDDIPGVARWSGWELSATAGADESGSHDTTNNDASRQLHLLPGLMTRNEVQHVREIAFSEERGFEETTLDTVDHQATFLCRVVEDGEALDAVVCESLAPFLEGRLLPYVRQKFGCASACIANVLIRRYLPDERRRLESHFDVSSFATAIVPLSPREDYAGGLYVQRVPGVTSRRYLDIEAGDCLVHRFDTMHGVHVPAGSRFSLIVWFSDSPDSIRSGTAPWVERAAAAGNSEAAFILGGFYCEHMSLSFSCLCRVPHNHFGRTLSSLSTRLPRIDLRPTASHPRSCLTVHDCSPRLAPAREQTEVSSDTLKILHWHFDGFQNRLRRAIHLRGCISVRC